MNEILKKLKNSYVEIEPELSVQKAFEKLTDPNIDTLIFKDPELKDFSYVTLQIIHQNIRHQNNSVKLIVKDVAIKSLIFNIDEYELKRSEYLKGFKQKLMTFGNKMPHLILIESKGKDIGLISDLVITNLEIEEESNFKSELDVFIETETDPVKSIDKFYNELIVSGFNITPEIKDYVCNLLKNRLETYNNNKVNQMPGSQEGQEGQEAIKVEVKKQEIKTTTIEPKDGKGLVVIYNPNHINHHSKSSSPEAPERITKIIDLLNVREKIFNENCRLISDYSPATEEDLLRVHTNIYMQFIMDYALRGGGFLGDSTYITKFTHDIALLAVGGAIRAAEEVLNGNSGFGLAIIRPPGHHASKDKYGGYCIYNNAAILARYLQEKFGLKKILILDWDAHAANGTMDIFYNDPSVMLISIHQDPHNYYPKTGFSSQMGKSRGLGYTINMEMPRGSGNEEYLTVLKELVIPVYENYKPEFIIGCNGFDTHHSDPYTDLNLTSEGYYKYCTYFRKEMRNKMAILMEGGYNPYMGELTHTIINGLLGLPNPFEDKYLSLVSKVISEEKTHLILNKKIKELKFNLNRYNIL